MMQVEKYVEVKKANFLPRIPLDATIIACTAG